MNIPTNLALTGEQVDHLLQAGSQLLRNDKEFQRLMRDLAAEDAEHLSSQNPDAESSRPITGSPTPPL